MKSSETTDKANLMAFIVSKRRYSRSTSQCELSQLGFPLCQLDAFYCFAYTLFKAMSYYEPYDCRLHDTPSRLYDTSRSTMATV